MRERLASIREEIERSGREPDVAKLAKSVEQGGTLNGPSDDEFDLLLPSERAAALPSYFLKLRTELVVLEGQSVDARRSGRLREWLDGPVPKLVEFGVAATKLAEFFADHGWAALQAIGLAYDAGDKSLTEGGSSSESEVI